MSESPEGEGSLIPAWTFALRMRRRIPLSLLLLRNEEQPAPEPKKTKGASGKRQNRRKAGSRR